MDFSSPSGSRYRVPGFYDGNGKGGLNGNVWKVRFSADERGPWSFETASDNVMLDGKAGISPFDSDIFHMLRSMTKPVLFAVNKIDGLEQEERLYEFYSIGVEELYPLSSEHGYGINDFLDRLVDALKPPDGRDARPLPDHRALLEAMTLPATVRLFIAPGCPFCPQALSQWIALARSGSLLRLHIIDGALFPEVAQDANVQAVPTLIFDDHWRWSGRIPVGDVLEQLATRDPSRLSADALDGIIKEGRAEAVARAIATSPEYQADGRFIGTAELRRDLFPLPEAQA